MGCYILSVSSSRVLWRVVCRRPNPSRKWLLPMLGFGPPSLIGSVHLRPLQQLMAICKTEFGKHDHEPSKYIKQWTGVKPKTGAPYSCDIGYERFLGPEIFFNPEIYRSDFSTPLLAVIDKCIQLSPIDTRRDLYKNIVLSGGSTMFKDFHRRLQRDLKKIADARLVASDARYDGEVKSQPVEVNAVNHPIQSFAVWFGGSVLASTPEFYTACHTKAEYDEYGARICCANPVFKGMY